MNQDEIIEMARQAGLMPTVLIPWSFEIHKFAKLVAAKEREACAKVCDDLWQEDGNAYNCREQIQARGES